MVSYFGGDVQKLSDDLVKAYGYTEVQASQVAYVAISHGLDPFIGEVCWLDGEGPEEGGVYIQLRGRERIVREHYDDMVIFSPDRIITAEKAGFSPGTGANNLICVEIEMRTSSEMQFYSAMMVELRQNGELTFDEAKSILGNPPVTRCIGICSIDDPAASVKNSSPLKHAIKRAKMAGYQKWPPKYVAPDVIPNIPIQEKREDSRLSRTEPEVADRPFDEAETLKSLGFPKKESNQQEAGTVMRNLPFENQRPIANLEELKAEFAKFDESTLLPNLSGDDYNLLAEGLLSIGDQIYDEKVQSPFADYLLGKIVDMVFPDGDDFDIENHPKLVDGLIRQWMNVKMARVSPNSDTVRYLVNQDAVEEAMLILNAFPPDEEVLEEVLFGNQEPVSKIEE